jgi:aryl-alcohol dehydrogenase-like predicted oxidoreductase
VALPLRKRLGSTSLEVFPICLGGNPFGWTADLQKSFGILDAYFDAGGNFIDTADEYSDWVPGNSGGESETIIGEWMRQRGNRDQIVLVSKVGLHHLRRGLSRVFIYAAIDDSLRRLGTDHVDLYYAHADDLNTPQQESLEAFDRLQKAGKIRFLGASNHSAERLESALVVSKALGLVSYQVQQPRYNLMDRSEFEVSLRPVCERHRIAVVAFEGLAQGFLTGKYRPDGPAVPGARDRAVRERYMNARGYSVLVALEAVSKETGASMATVALAWMLNRPGVATPLASASNASQVPHIVGAAGLKLDVRQMRALTAAGQ